MAILAMYLSPARALEPLYPVGTTFPLGLYSTVFEDTALSAGWNFAHSYHFGKDMTGFIDKCKQADMWTHGRLPGELSESEFGSLMEMLDATGHIGWWDFPEEQRYWKDEEMATVINYAAWTREYDSHKRPNYHYIPGHYGQSAVEHYVEYLDIVPASCYTTYAGKPHSWVRWRVESTIAAIQARGKTLGRDYLSDQKTVVGLPELFGTSGEITAEGAYHDFWSILASGGKGIMIYSHWHLRDDTRLQQAWEQYCEAARRVQAEPHRLDQAILFGEYDESVTVAVVSGPERTPSFEVSGNDLDYPSVNVRALRHNGSLYLIAVNSAEQSVTARIGELPTEPSQATVLFEDRTLSIGEGDMEDSFEALGVHLYKVSLQSTTLGQGPAFSRPGSVRAGGRPGSPVIAGPHVFDLRGRPTTIHAAAGLVVYSLSDDRGPRHVIKLRSRL